MKSGRLKALSLLLAAAGGAGAYAAGPAPAAGPVVMAESFASQDAFSAWRQDGAEGRWVPQGSAEDGYAVLPRGALESGRFPLTPYAYYEVRLRARARGPSYWFMRFFDEQGAEITADHYTRLYGSEPWAEQVFYLMARAGTAQASFGLRPIDGPLQVDDLRVAPASREVVLSWMDRQADALSPLPPETFAHGRLRHLGRSLARLEAGRPLTVVVLGDSLANDLCNSMFQLLLERSFPGSRVRLVHSVRSGTGCGYYKGPGRVREYVLRHRPDLLIIGGISNGGAGNVLEVIRQVRAEQDPDVLVLSGGVRQLGVVRQRSAGRRTTRFDPERQRAEEEAGRRFFAELDGPRDELRYAVYDLRGAFAAYVERSGKPYTWYQRDWLHSNERGKQVMGRLVHRFLTAESAAPSAAGTAKGRPAAGQGGGGPG